MRVSVRACVRACVCVCVHAHTPLTALLCCILQTQHCTLSGTMHISKMYVHLNKCYLCSLTLPHVNCITEQIICVDDTQN